MTAPHPLRCENKCNYYFRKDEHPDQYFNECRANPNNIIPISNAQKFVISRCGCASHTSVPTSAEQVLEKAWVRIETMAPDEGIYLGWVLLSNVDAVLKGMQIKPRQRGREQG